MKIYSLTGVLKDDCKTGRFVVAETILTECWLFAASILDIRNRRIPVWMLVLGGSFTVLTVVSRSGLTLAECVEMVKGCVPGTILLVMAAVTGKAGTADGIILIFLGICMGSRICLTVFVLSLVLISVFSGVLLALRRAGRNTRLPYLPFLSAALLLGQALIF